MAAACSYWPARSSSKPWPIAWEGSTRATRMSSPTVQLLLRRIQSPKILEYQAPLLRGEALQLLPRGVAEPRARAGRADRKSTRLNSSHSQISYAVFCLKKKKLQTTQKYAVYAQLL